MKDNKKVVPNRMKAKVGQDVAFTCTSDEEVRWIYSRGPLPPNARQHHQYKTVEHNLVIKSVVSNNTGTYTCEGKERKELHHFYAEGKLIVLDGKYSTFQGLILIILSIMRDRANLIFYVHSSFYKLFFFAFTQHNRCLFITVPTSKQWL